MFHSRYFDNLSDLASAVSIQVVGNDIANLSLFVFVSYLEDATHVLSPLDDIFFPSTIIHDSTTVFSSFPLRYLHAPDGIPNKLGSYSLSINVSGGNSGNDNAGIEVVYPFGSGFIVKGSEEPVPGPKMKRAVFSSDGSKILVEFDGRTNGLSSKSLSNCSRLFQITSPSALSSIRCLWVSDESLEMYSVSGLDVGDVIELKKSVLKARCTSQTDPLCVSWPFSVPHNITVSVDLDLLSAVVVNLKIPSGLGACDDLSLDLSSSVGSGGRDWKFLSFAVSSSSSSSPLQQHLTNLTSSKSFSLSLSLPILLPNNLFARGASYSLTVELCSFLGNCGQTSRSFIV
jgi:hypothetical protein